MDIDLEIIKKWIHDNAYDISVGKVVTLRLSDVTIMINEIERLRTVIEDFKRAMSPHDYVDVTEENVEKLYQQAETLKHKLDKLTSTTTAEQIRLKETAKKIKEIAELARKKHD